MVIMKIGELAKKTGLTTQSIRYYENIGLLPEPRRRENGYREYDHTTADRISFVRDAQASGLSLTEIHLILELRDQGEPTCGHVVFLLEQHVDEVENQITELQRTRERLEQMIERAQKLDPSECQDSVRCQTISSKHENPVRLAPSRE